MLYDQPIPTRSYLLVLVCLFAEYVVTIKVLCIAWLGAVGWLWIARQGSDNSLNGLITIVTLVVPVILALTPVQHKGAQKLLQSWATQAYPVKRRRR